MKVDIICHRGMWEKPEEQNTLVAFQRAWDAGFGVELDVRDCVGSLVVCHDPPSGEYESHLGLTEVLDALRDRPNTFAVNVKSCGLAPWFAQLKAPKNWFFFDMAENDEKEYRKLLLPVQKAGVYKDSSIFLMSAELHGLGHLVEGNWSSIRSIYNNVILVTDLWNEAREFFK